MLDYTFWLNLKHKKDRTEAEELLLELKYSIATITEILEVYNKKQWVPEKALIEIDLEVKDVINKM